MDSATATSVKRNCRIRTMMKPRGRAVTCVCGASVGGAIFA